MLVNFFWIFVKFLDFCVFGCGGRCWDYGFWLVFVAFGGLLCLLVCSYAFLWRKRLKFGILGVLCLLCCDCKQELCNFVIYRCLRVIV